VIGDDYDYDYDYDSAVVVINGRGIKNRPLYELCMSGRERLYMSRHERRAADVLLRREAKRARKAA
jgi:hypothetical protein